MNEIILFCYGDSTKTSTWSNVPYLMAQSFEKQNIKVRRVNIAPNKYLNRIANTILRFMIKNGDYTYIRTRLFYLITNKKIRQAVTKYHNADFCIFLNFDFYNKFSSIPSLIFSDWTYKILIEDRLNHIPTKRENKFMRQQEYAINHADIVLPLFSESVEKMRHTYPNANIQSIGQNVINNLDTEPVETNTLIRQKFNSNFILFIGRLAYREGLDTIIHAVRELNSPIEIHVIGISKHQMPETPEFVKFHGYLKKDDAIENREYYELMKHAKLIANPTPKWAAYSSIVEGMYFCNPVIVSTFNQFVKEFGQNIDFGFYNNGSIMELKNAIEKIFNMPEPEYSKLALNAHDKVKNYTWDNYVSEMTKMMNEVK